jgi:hypothetical protein
MATKILEPSDDGASPTGEAPVVMQLRNVRRAVFRIIMAGRL